MASDLLGQLGLEGKVVTGDALYCQQELSQRILEQGGDYFWVLLFLGSQGQPAWGERGGEPALCGASLGRELC